MLKAGINQEQAISIDGKTEDCVDLGNRLLPRAEKELGAFARAVNELFGSAHAGQSIKDWVEEFESIHWPAGGAIPDWRRVTIAAAGRLAGRVEEAPLDERLGNRFVGTLSTRSQPEENSQILVMTDVDGASRFDGKITPLLDTFVNDER